MPLDRKKSSADSEKIYFELIEKLKAIIKIPIALKIGYRFSNILVYDRSVLYERC